ncbi:MAG: Protein QmcA (possibly involved in integral membrane quality control), partial [uncultured Acetobacteraceae bacterium]
DHRNRHLPRFAAAGRRHRLEGHQDGAARLGVDGGAVRRLHAAAAPGAQPHHPLRGHRRPQDERAGGGARHPGAIGHHPRQRHGRGGRHRLLPRDGSGQGGLPSAGPDRRLGGAGHDQHPLGDRRDGPGRDAERARANQLLPAGNARRRHGPLGREGRPRRDPQGGAAGEPGARHEPPDDRRTRAPRHGDAGGGRPRRRHPARGGREAGADPLRRGPPTSGAARRRGARALGGGGGARDRDGGPGRRGIGRGGAPLLHRGQVREGFRGLGVQSLQQARRGADGGERAGGRHHRSDGTAAGRRTGGRRSPAGGAISAANAVAAVPATCHQQPAGGRRVEPGL